MGLVLCVGKGQEHGGQTMLPVPGGARRSEEGTVSQQRPNAKLMMGVGVGAGTDISIPCHGRFLARAGKKG